jgi:hypothetical protein
LANPVVPHLSQLQSRAGPTLAIRSRSLPDNVSPNRIVPRHYLLNLLTRSLVIFKTSNGRIVSALQNNSPRSARGCKILNRLDVNQRAA